MPRRSLAIVRRGATGHASAWLKALPRVDAPEGAIAQLGERVLCKHEVVGSIPSGSTRMPSASEIKSLPLRHRVLRPVVRHREEVI